MIFKGLIMFVCLFLKSHKRATSPSSLRFPESGLSIPMEGDTVWTAQ